MKTKIMMLETYWKVWHALSYYLKNLIRFCKGDEMAHEKRERKARNLLRKRFDRMVLVENFCTEFDETLRKVDQPERFIELTKERGEIVLTDSILR
jgi:hypothetical protein